MNLFKKSNLFHDEESLFFKYLSNFSKTSNTKNQFNKLNSLDNNPNLLSITSYAFPDNHSNNNKYISLKNSIKIIPNKTMYKIYKEKFKPTNNIKNKLKNSFYLKILDNFKSKPKELALDNNNLNSLKKINLELFAKPYDSFKNQRNRTFSHRFGKIKRKVNNSYFSTFTFKNKKMKNF